MLESVYHRFVKNYAMIAAPLTDLLKDGSPDPLNELDVSEMKAFHALIKAITERPVLALPIADARFSLETERATARLVVLFLNSTKENGDPLDISAGL